MNLDHVDTRWPVGQRLLRSAVHVALVALMGITACSNEEASWDASTSIAGAEIGDQESFDERWREYRVAAMATLDLMERSVENAFREASVADREELTALSRRIYTLRERLLAEFDVPRDDALSVRRELENSFVGLRGDVEAVLVRIGHDPEEFARWHAPS